MPEKELFDPGNLDVHSEEDVRSWLDKAARVISCSWFIGSIRHRSDGRWVPLIIFGDETSGQFSYAFEIRNGEPEVAAFCARLRGAARKCSELNG